MKITIASAEGKCVVVDKTAEVIGPLVLHRAVLYDLSLSRHLYALTHRATGCAVFNNCDNRDGLRKAAKELAVLDWKFTNPRSPKLRALGKLRLEAMAKYGL